MGLKGWSTEPKGVDLVTFPGSLADVPAHTTAQWPGNGTDVQYSEGLKVGYRWYDAQNIDPLFLNFLQAGFVHDADAGDPEKGRNRRRS